MGLPRLRVFTLCESRSIGRRPQIPACGGNLPKNAAGQGAASRRKIFRAAFFRAAAPRRSPPERSLPLDLAEKHNAAACPPHRQKLNQTEI